ncbi:hypothetical protein G3M48_010384, partial [Beauveria asiatica]
FDVLFLRQQGVKYPRWHLTAPIRRDTRVRLSYGASVSANDLIGKPMLERAVDDKGNAVAVYEPTLASYIVNSDRVATPVRATFSFAGVIYPSDAATIVSLLDLHPVRPGEEDENDDEGQPDDGPFEVFEAGTGMGSLSLHIARALHAANPPVPAPHAVAAALVPALHDNAVLVLFCPSISQVAEFQAWALESGAPLRLEKVLEMPTTSTADGVRDGGCGGRHWDVKIIKPKPARAEEDEGTGEDAPCDGPATESEPVVVMRPKVGGRVAGGGFLAVYRKWPAGTNRQQPEEPEADSEAEA